MAIRYSIGRTPDNIFTRQKMKKLSGFRIVFNDSVPARMMDAFLDNWGLDLTKTDIAEIAGVSRDSIYRILPIWEKLGIVKETRKIGATTLYTLNKDNEAVKALKTFDWKLTEYIIDKEIELEEPLKPIKIAIEAA